MVICVGCTKTILREISAFGENAHLFLGWKRRAKGVNDGCISAKNRTEGKGDQGGCDRDSSSERLHMTLILMGYIVLSERPEVRLVFLLTFGVSG